MQAGPQRIFPSPRLAHFPDPTRLPAPLTPLVGREPELALAAKLLQRDEVRLLTITGPGGIGKTRLAIEIGRTQAASFANGVVYVPLAAISDPEQVAPAIVRALGAQETIGVNWRDRLVILISDADLLIVIDNFEHILPAAPLLTDLLGACPHLKIVATSRSLLRLAGEYAIPVPPLVLPDSVTDRSLASVSQSPAVQLFVDRVQAVIPGFALAEETALLVAAICRHMDGLPLAIELAAAQAAVLPPAALLDRVQARLPLPVAGPRDAPARLRTIAEAVAWSYDLLTDDEQRLFRRVSVFAGGFALDAAEAVASPDVLPGLASLAEKNLLRQEAWEGEARFAMLETIRTFARDQAVANGEAEANGELHAAWALALAEPVELAGVTPGQERKLRRLEVDDANLVVALRWFDDHGDSERLLRLAGALGGNWVVNGHYREGRAWLERALELAPATPTPARGRVQIGLGRVLGLFGEVERADSLLAEGIDALDPHREVPVLAFSVNRRAVIASQLGAHDQAKRYLNHALDLARTIDDPVLAATIGGFVQANLGVAAHGLGDLDQALLHHEEALHIFREQAFALGMARCQRDIGDIRRDQGDLAGALACYRDCIASQDGHYDLHVVMDALEGVALVAASWQQPAMAARFMGAAEALREEWGGTFAAPFDQLAHERTFAAIRQSLAEPEIAAAWQGGRACSMVDACAEILALALIDEMPPSSAGRVKLSPRELQVLRLVVVGHPDRVIADELFLSVRTVEAHVARILAKLGVHTRTAAAGAAIAAGFADPPRRSTPADPESTAD